MTRNSEGFRLALPYPVVRLRGEALRPFGNGMFTNNLRDLPLHTHQSTAFTDDRGRLLGLAELWLEADDSALVVLDGLDRDGFEQLFRVHLMLEEIEVDEPSYTTWFIEAPVEGPCWPTRFPGHIALLEHPPEGVDLPEEAYHAARIAHGVPCFADAGPKQLPHELGLRDTHLHFEKGCYRGQEIIHRVDVMGGVRKQLTGLRLARPFDTDVLTTEEGRKVGRIGTHAEHPTLGRIALGVVRNEHREPGTRLLAGDAPVETVALPMVS